MKVTILIVTMALLLAGCAEQVVRLGAGDCAAIIKEREVLSVGKDCGIQRMYR